MTTSTDKIDMVTTEFIRTPLPRLASPQNLDQVIEQHLRQQGIPLRWAITAVSPEQMTIEAVILKTPSTN